MQAEEKKLRESKPSAFGIKLKTVGSELKTNWRLWISRLLFLLGPFISLCTVEILNEKNPFVNLNPTEWVMNLALYAVIYTVFWLIFGRRRRTIVCVETLLLLCGIVNHFVVVYRGRILFPSDILCWQTAANVAGEYSFAPDQFVWGALAVYAVYMLLVKFVMLPQKERSYCSIKWINIVFGAAAGAYIVAFFFSPWLFSAGIKTQQWKTQSNGFLLNFSIALRYSHFQKPSGYSEEAVAELTDALQETQEMDSASAGMQLYQDANISSSFEQSEGPVVTGSSDIQPTNIVAIMNESFADLAMFDNLEVNGDTMPFYHSLTENTIKGWMYSPVTGGGTANVEYEYLTGNSTRFLPDGTVAYQLYVKDNEPSLCSLAAALGYKTTAFHPYMSSGWNRPLVYSYMGFDKQIYNSDVIDRKLVRGYISDETDFNVLRSITDEEQGDKNFIFNVTMQNHGGYDQGWNNLEQTLMLDGNMTGISEYTEEYLNLIKNSDEALEELLTSYENSDEPTIVVMFGDHQPKLTEWFYEKLYGKPLDERTLEEVQAQYVTPFLIWANYDIGSANNIMISTDYLGVLTAETANLPLTGYMQFLSDLYNEIPVINTIGYVTADGVQHEDESTLTEKQQKLLNQYEYLSYYNLRGDRNSDIDDFFFLGENTTHLNEADAS